MRVVGVTVRGVEHLRQPVDFLRAGEVRHRTVVPRDLHRVDGRHGMPRRVGDHGHARRAAMVAIHLHHVQHTGHCGRRARVERLHRAAQRGAHHDARVSHARQRDVDAERRRAVELRRVLDAAHRRADQLELRGRLERCVARHRQQRSGGDEFTECGALARHMLHHTLRDGDLRCRYLPRVSRGAHEHRARGRAGLTHWKPEVLRARRAAGEHQATVAHHFRRHPRGRAADQPIVIRMERQSIDHGRDVVVDRALRRHFRADLRPVGIEFVGQQHRQRGMNALTHLGLRHDHGDVIVGADPHPAVECGFAWLRRQRVAVAKSSARRQQAPADAQCAGGGHGAYHEGPAIHAERARQAVKV